MSKLFCESYRVKKKRRKKKRSNEDEYGNDDFDEIMINMIKLFKFLWLFFLQVNTLVLWQNNIVVGFIFLTHLYILRSFIQI